MKILAFEYIGEGRFTPSTETLKSSLACRKELACGSDLNCLPSGRVATFSAPQSMRKLSFGMKEPEGAAGGRPAEDAGDENAKSRRTRRVAIKDDKKGDDRKCGAAKLFM